MLGLWTSATEGAKFWLGVLTELKNRGVKDVFIVSEGLSASDGDRVSAGEGAVLHRACDARQFKLCELERT